VANVFPLFKETPRYWAFCEIAGVKNPEEALPESVSRDIIDNEKEYLQKTFGL
jgi:hypothetical protein